MDRAIMLYYLNEKNSIVFLQEFANFVLKSM